MNTRCHPKLTVFGNFYLELCSTADRAFLAGHSQLTLAMQRLLQRADLPLFPVLQPISPADPLRADARDPVKGVSKMATNGAEWLR